MALGSNGIRTAAVAFDFAMSEDGFGGTSGRRVSNWVERRGVWRCARFERDRREWESEIRTMADAELDGDRSAVDGAERWVGMGGGEGETWGRLQGGWSSPGRYLSQKQQDGGQKGGKVKL